MLAWVLVTLLYISSVGVATRGRGSRSSRQQDSAHLLQPEFGPAPNLTRVQVDSTAFLHCNVLNLQEDNQVGAPSINSYSRSLVVNKLFVIICLSFDHDLIFLVRFSTLLYRDLNDCSTLSPVSCSQSPSLYLWMDSVGLLHCSTLERDRSVDTSTHCSRLQTSRITPKCYNAELFLNL